VGGVAATGDFSVYFSLTRLIGWFSHNYLMANACSFVIGSIIGYFLNKNWTFRQGHIFVPSQYLKYLIANLITLAILQLFFYFFVEIIGLYDMIAKILLLAISIGINFSFSKFWTFKLVAV
jgi:putative flippase GtrA